MNYNLQPMLFGNSIYKVSLQVSDYSLLSYFLCALGQFWIKDIPLFRQWSDVGMLKLRLERCQGCYCQTRKSYFTKSLFLHHCAQHLRWCSTSLSIKKANPCKFSKTLKAEAIGNFSFRRHIVFHISYLFFHGKIVLK